MPVNTRARSTGRGAQANRLRHLLRPGGAGDSPARPACGRGKPYKEK
jgi:hypothetical protein